MIRKPKQGDELRLLMLTTVLIFLIGAGAGNLFLISFNSSNQWWVWSILFATCALFIFIGVTETTLDDNDEVMELRVYSAVFACAALLTSQTIYLTVVVGACHYTGMRLGHCIRDWRQRSRRR